MSFVSEDAERRRIPVAIVSGFLGSGKTSLINALLKDKRLANTAVAINEFGETPLDHHLIDHGDDKTIVLANGCMCCNLSGDMDEAVMRLFARTQDGSLPQFDRLIVEPSGLADPAPIAQSILRHPIMSRIFNLESIVVVADAVLVQGQLKKHEMVRKQLSLADRIVVTKGDISSQENIAELRMVFSGLNPLAPVSEAVLGKIRSDEIFSERFLDGDRGYQPVARWFERFAQENTSHVHRHETGIRSISLTSDRPVPWHEFEVWLRKVRIRYGRSLLRTKAIVNRLGGERPLVVHAVEHVAHAPVELDKWPSADRRTRLVLIGQDIDIAEIEQGWCSFLQFVDEKNPS